MKRTDKKKKERRIKVGEKESKEGHTPTELRVRFLLPNHYLVLFVLLNLFAN